MASIARCLMLASIPTIATAEPAEPPAPPAVTVGAAVETYYQHRLDRPALDVVPLRLEAAHGDFTLASATLEVGLDGSGWRGRLVLAAGATPTAVVAGEAEPASWRPLREANAGAEVGAGVTVDGGLFLSPIGPESIASKDGWNWSRSTPFLALPAYHVGVRVDPPARSTASSPRPGWSTAGTPPSRQQSRQDRAGRRRPGPDGRHRGAGVVRRR
jgi:hypothetical protein